LEILSRHDSPSAVLEALPQDISTPEIKLQMQEGEPHALIARLQQEGDCPSATAISTIDGVRAEYNDGFGLARASNTTPGIVLRCDAESDAGLERIKGAVRQAFTARAPEVKLPF